MTSRGAAARRLGPLLALLAALASCQLREIQRGRKLRATGLELLRTGQREQARRQLEAALALARQASARAWYDYRGELARALLDAAAGAEAVGQLGSAIERLDEALGFASLAGNDALRADALARRAALRFRAGEPEEAARDYAASARAWHRSDDLARQAEALSSGAIVLARLGKFDQAARLHQRARQLAVLSGDLAAQAQALNNGAALAASLGRSVEAGRQYREALRLARQARDRLQEAFALNNLGLLEVEQGHFGAGLGLYRQALRLKQQARDHVGQAVTHANVSDLFLILGQPQAAQQEARSALEQAQRSGDLRAVSVALVRSGELDQIAGRPEDALAAYARARRLARRVRDQRGETVATMREAQVLLGLGQPRQARQRFETAAATAAAARAGALSLQAWANLCRVDLADPSLPAARLSSCEQAAARARQAVDPTLRFQGLRLEALWRLRRGEEPQALSALRRAARLLEQTRLRAGTDRFKQGLFGGRVGIFDRLIGLLVTRQPREAFAQAERARARGLLDLLLEARVDLTAGAPPATVARERRAATAVAQARKRAAQASGDDVGPASSALLAALAELDAARAELRARSPRAAALGTIEPAALGEVQAALAPGELLLEYHIADPTSFLFVVGRNHFAVHPLPGKEQLAPTVRLFQDLTGGGASDPQSQADRLLLGHRLYRRLVAPAGAPLRSARRLVIVPHGATAYLPFAALLTGPVPDPEHAPAATLPYLVRRYEVELAPSATILLHLRRAPRHQRPRLDRALRQARDLLAIGNPVLTGPGDGSRKAGTVRLGPSRAVAWPPHERLAPLPFAGVEVDQIARLFAHADVLLAQSATLRRTRELLGRSRHRYVHFATHGIVDERHPELSGLVLTPEADDDGFLPLYEVYRLRLQAELVVLSACETAIGREVAGEGLIGLARGFLHAGARGVVASLWSVPDESTSVLMRRFYEILPQAPDHAAALRRAQLELLGGAAGQGQPGRFSHPRHWAGFALIGD